MQPSLDWKFLVIILATLAGVIVPVWLWQADLQAKSLNVRIVSQTSLEPDISRNVEGIKISVDNKSIERPYLTVLKLSNDGRRPILATDFEEALEIQVAGDISIVRAQSTDRQPKDIQPKTTFDAKALRLMPLLLNPDDNITFAIVTAGGPPEFSVRSRVAGIAAIALEEKITKGASPTLHIIRAFLGFGLALVYASCLSMAFMPQLYELRKPTLILAGLSAAGSNSLLLKPLVDDFALSYTQYIVLSLAYILIAFVINRFLNRRQSPEL